MNLVRVVMDSRGRRCYSVLNIGPRSLKVESGTGLFRMTGRAKGLHTCNAPITFIGFGDVIAARTVTLLALHVLKASIFKLIRRGP